MLYKQWNERVFEPIHKELRKVMDSNDYKILENKKRELFDNYLSYSMTKDVFLDTVSRDEYNPDKFKQLKVREDTSLSHTCCIHAHTYIPGHHQSTE